MKIKDLENNDLYNYLKIGEILSTKYFRESNINKQSADEYLIISQTLNKLYEEANKRLKNLK